MSCLSRMRSVPEEMVASVGAVRRKWQARSIRIKLPKTTASSFNLSKP